MRITSCSTSCARGTTRISTKSVREVFHDATFAKERAHELFKSGVLSLRGRAMAETLYIATVNEIAKLAQLDREEYADLLPDVESALVDRYFCNFSRLPVAARQLGDRPALSRSCRFIGSMRSRPGAGRCRT